ncbi:MAG: BatD family protein, partial [Deltaproteobacteria bacterium]|nr:BatD family protein [Deltaproteobacteria bacterium]
QIQVQASGGEPETRLPDFRGFDVVGRRTFRPMQLTIGMGGQVVVQSTTVHTYVLRATTPGTFRIGPAVARLGGRDFQSGVVSVIVRSPNAAPPSAPAPPGAPGGITLTPVPPGGTPLTPVPPSPPPPFGVPPMPPPTVPTYPTPVPPTDPGFPSPPTGTLDGASYDPQGFVRVVTEPVRPVVGQQVTVTVYLYSRAQPTSLQVSREPTTEGFWIHDLLPAQRTIDSRQQVVGDTRFWVTVVKRFAAFPLRAGPLTIGPATVHADTRSIFDLWGSGGSGPLERTGIPITVEAQEAPPTGRPAGFEALHVGRYRLTSTVDRPTTRTGEAVSYRLDLAGTGNIRNVRIRLPRVDGLRALEPQVRDTVTSQGDAVGGTRHMEWLVIPERPGTFTIPALQIPFYDPVERRYVTLEAPAATIVAVGAAAPVPQPDPQDPSATPDPSTSPDARNELRTVRSTSALTRGSRSVAETPWLWLLAAVMPLAWIGTLVASGIRRVTSRVTPEAAQKKALSGARKRLSEAERLARSGDARAFHAEVARAIKAALEAKLGEQIGGYTLPQLREHLSELGMDPAAVHGVVEELESCDFARFSSGAVDASEMDACLGRSARWIDAIAGFSPKRDEDEAERAAT